MDDLNDRSDASDEEVLLASDNEEEETGSVSYGSFTVKKRSKKMAESLLKQAINSSDLKKDNPMAKATDLSSQLALRTLGLSTLGKKVELFDLLANKRNSTRLFEFFSLPDDFTSLDKHGKVRKMDLSLTTLLDPLSYMESWDELNPASTDAWVSHYRRQCEKPDSNNVFLSHSETNLLIEAVARLAVAARNVGKMIPTILSCLTTEQFADESDAKLNRYLLKSNVNFMFEELQVAKNVLHPRRPHSNNSMQFSPIFKRNCHTRVTRRNKFPLRNTDKMRDEFIGGADEHHHVKATKPLAAAFKRERSALDRLTKFVKGRKRKNPFVTPMTQKPKKAKKSTSKKKVFRKKKIPIKKSKGSTYVRLPESEWNAMSTVQQAEYKKSQGSGRQKN